MTTMPDWKTAYGRALRIAAMAGALVSSITVGITILLFISTVGFEFWKDIVKEHFPATIGLTGACILSFATVVFLRQTEGPIEFEAVGMKFKGAAGQVVLWAFCIVVLVLCTK